jgi:transposase-like protein
MRCASGRPHRSTRSIRWCFFDALRVKIRGEGLVKNKAVYVALALNPAGEKEFSGCGSSGAKA